MKIVKKSLALALALICLIACLPTAASAESAGWTQAWVEQALATVPEVNVYIYPVDSDNNIVTGLNKNSVTIEATLDGEQLSVESFDPVKDQGCFYIILLNIAIASNNSANAKDYLKSVKTQLVKWVEELNDNDKFALISYAGDCKVELDGSESRDSAKRIISNIEPVYISADAVPAIKEAIKLAGLEENKTPERRVAVMIDNCEFLLNESTLCNDLINSLVDARLPLYFMCNSVYSEAVQAAGEFANATGGIVIASKEEKIDLLRSWLNGCYLLKMKCASNNPEPLARELYIKFSDNGGELEMSGKVKVEGNIADTEPPTVKYLEIADNLTVSVTFSEEVKGAGELRNYTVTEKKSGKEHTIASVDYDNTSFTAILTMEEKLSGGDYSLTIDNITDTSYEANPLKYADNTNQLEFSIDGKNTLIYIVIGAALLVLCVVVVVIVLINKKKKREEEQKRIEEERKKSETSKTSIPNFPVAPGGVLNQKYSEQRGMQLPVSLAMVLPNGLKSKADVTVGQTFKIGRSESKSDLSIADETMSGLHMTLSYNNGLLIISDAGSTNGTFVNGVKIGQPRQLNSGDVITLGKTRITVKF
jgi:hypothetical protein